MTVQGERELIETAPLRIAAGGVFKNAGEILAPAMAHLIGQGITDFYLVAHDDEQHAPEHLITAFGERANLTIISYNNPVFLQAQLTNMIMNLARNEGFDIFVPFDADEFYATTDPSVTLSECLRDWAATDNGEQLSVKMINYFVPEDVEHFRARTLERMHSFVEVSADAPANAISIRLRPAGKSISRLSGIPDAAYTFITGGNHRTFRGSADLKKFKPKKTQTRPVVIRHIPWRSRSFALDQEIHRPEIGVRLSPQMTIGRRRGTSAPRGGRRREEIVETEWGNYSLSSSSSSTERTELANYSLVPDDGCLRVIDGIINAGFDPDDEWCRSTLPVPSKGSEYVSRTFVDDPLFGAGVTALSAQFHRFHETFQKRGVTPAAINPDSAMLRVRNKELRAEVRRLRETLAATRARIPVATVVLEPPSFARRAVNKLRRLVVNLLSRRQTEKEGAQGRGR